MPEFQVDSSERIRAENAVQTFAQIFGSLSVEGKKVAAITFAKYLGGPMGEILKGLKENTKPTVVRKEK